MLLAHTLGRTRSWVLAHPESSLSASQLDWLQQAMTRLESGEPLAYLLGKWEFYGLTFSVTPAVLIPRPETELLVELAIQSARRTAAPYPQPVRIADVGTGSGCIAVSLAVHLPGAVLAATDLSWNALQVARRNAAAHQVERRIHLVHTDLLLPCAANCFDLVCANLPYIPSASLHQLAVYGQEPTLALDGGTDGLALLRRLLQQAHSCLAPGGLLLAEIEASLGPAALDLAHQQYPHARSSILPDYTATDRLLKVEL